MTPLPPSQESFEALEHRLRTILLRGEGDEGTDDAFEVNGDRLIAHSEGGRSESREVARRNAMVMTLMVCSSVYGRSSGLGTR